MSDLLRFERPCPRQGPFARPALPGVLTTMDPSDSRPGLMEVIDSPHPSMLVASPGRASQVPRLICRSLPSPLTPVDPVAAHTCCSTTGAGFAFSGRLTIHKLSNEAGLGSRLRITADSFASRGFEGRVTPTPARSATRPTGNCHG
jgi:hypothetical protein